MALARWFGGVTLLMVTMTLGLAAVFTLLAGDPFTAVLCAAPAYLGFRWMARIGEQYP